MAAAPLLLSLCMIVKDEEKNILRCLESIHNIVDEIIIVDTGSVDQTIQKAKEYGAKIYHFPWLNDFSAARNQALRQTNGQWTLILDADEYLDRTEAVRLRQTLRTAKEEGFYVSIYNYQGPDWGNYTKTYSLRLFRSHPSYHYEGKIHEQILPSILKANPKAFIGWSSFVIHHDGYSRCAALIKVKAERNLEILRCESPDVKDSSFYCLNLALEYIRLGRILEAEIKLKEGWKKVNPQASYSHYLLLKLIACLHRQKKDSEAIAYCRQGLNLYPDFADILYYYGICLLKTGAYEEAKKVLISGLQQSESPQKYITQAGFHYQAALDYYLQAFRLQPHQLSYLKSLIRVLLKCERNQKMYLIKNSLLTRETVQTIVQTAYTLNHYSLVLEILSDWENVDTNWELPFIEGKSLMRLGKYEEALIRLNTIPQQNPLSKDCLFYSWLCSVLQEDFKLSLHYSAQLKDHEDRLSRLLSELHDILKYGFATNSCENPRVFRNNENVLALLEIIDNLAACQSEKLLDPAIAFLIQIAGEDFNPLLLRILNERHYNYEAVNLFKHCGKEDLDQC